MVILNSIEVPENQHLFKILTIARSQNLKTSLVPNNANSHGNAEEQELVREVAGAMDGIHAIRLLSQIKHQDYYQIAEIQQILSTV